jgi:hypothetical protein
VDVGRAAGKNKGVDIANFLAELGAGKAQGDFKGLRAGGQGGGEVFVVGFAL